MASSKYYLGVLIGLAGLVLILMSVQRVSGMPDLTIEPSDIILSDPEVTVNENITITAQIHNNGTSNATMALTIADSQKNFTIDLSSGGATEM